MAVVLGVVFVIVAVLVEAGFFSLFLFGRLLLLDTTTCSTTTFFYTSDAFLNFVAVVVTMAKFSAN